MATKPGHASIESEYELHDYDTAYLVTKPENPNKSIKRQLSKKEAAKLRWLPWLVFAFAVNIFFFFSMLYALVDIDRYERGKVQYFLTAWMILIIPSAIVAILVVTPYPRSFRRFRHRWSDKEPSPNFLPGTNFVSAILCCLAVASYLYIEAIPRYNDAVWTSEAHYASDLPLPAVAMIFWSNATTPTTLTQAQRDSGKFPTCRISNLTSDRAFDCSSYLLSTTIENYSALIFDPTKLPVDQGSFNDLRSTLTIFSYANYDSRLVDTNTTSADQFTVAATFFDARMDHSILGQCGLVGLATLPVFATTYVDLQLTETQDPWELLHDPTRPVVCAEAHSKLVAKSTDPYRSWSWALNAMSLTDVNTCDVATHGDGAICRTTAAISYSTKMKISASSGPGISVLDIWINAGSIVGGVQFFFWFLTLFSAY